MTVDEDQPTMQLQVRLFAGLKARAGTGELALELPIGAVARDLLEQLRWLTGDTSVVIAVNREYATPDVVLQPGDELALIPPISGGAEPSAIHVRISHEPLSADAVTALVIDDRAGAIVTFQGVTRDVPALEYEAYVEMAQQKLTEIAMAAAARHQLYSAAVEHRTGTVALSEPSVVIAASARHRDQAFAGAREIIDQIKQQAPIWKREEGEWIEAHSPTPAAEGDRSGD